MINIEEIIREMRIDPFWQDFTDEEIKEVIEFVYDDQDELWQE